MIRNIHMSRDSCLSCQYAGITNLRAPCDSNLRNNKAIFSNFHIMSQVNQVIYFRTTANYGVIHRPIIYGTAASHFHIILQNRFAKLPDMGMMTCRIRRKPKPLSTNYRMGTKNHTISKNTVLMNHCAWIQLTILTNFRILTDIYIRIDDSTASDFCTVIHNNIRHNRYMLANNRCFTNYCRRMNFTVMLFFRMI